MLTRAIQEANKFLCCDVTKHNGCDKEDLWSVVIDSLLLCQNCLKTSELGFLCLAALIVGGSYWGKESVHER